MWGNAAQTYMQRLDVLLNRAGRIILRVPPRTSCQFVLGWESLQAKRLRHLNIIAYKCLCGFLPDYLSSLFSYVSDQHSYHTRHCVEGNLSLPQPRTEFGKGTFQFGGVQAWNNWPLRLKHPIPTSLHMFKKNLS